MDARDSMRVQNGSSALDENPVQLRACAKINSGFAGGHLACWRGANDEHILQGSVRSEQQRQRAKWPQPAGAERRLAGCFVTRRSQGAEGHALVPVRKHSRLAAGQAALPPKPEVI